MNNMRSVLRQLLFAVPPKGAQLQGQRFSKHWQEEAGHSIQMHRELNIVEACLPLKSEFCFGGNLEQLDHSKPICVPAGKEGALTVGFVLLRIVATCNARTQSVPLVCQPAARQISFGRLYLHPFRMDIKWK